MSLTLKTMYVGQKDSPSTYIVGDIGTTDTSVVVGSAEIFASLSIPFPLTLGFDRSITETVIVTEVGSSNQLTIIRDENPYTWVAGTKCARVFTASDLKAIQDNIAMMAPKIDSNTADIEIEKDRITQNTTDIANETSRALLAENVLAGNLTAEISRATLSEQNNYQAIQNEILRATGKENDLATQKINRTELTTVITNIDYTPQASDIWVKFTTYNAQAQAIGEFSRYIPVATNLLAGLMSPTEYTELIKLRQDVGTLQRQGGRFIGQSFATKAELNAYVIPESTNAGDFTYVLDDEDKQDATTCYIYNGTSFNFAYVVEFDPIEIANNEIPGIVLGSAAGEGKIKVDINGTMSVIGWDNFGNASTQDVSTSASDIKMDGIASAGSTGKVADAGHVHPITYAEYSANLLSGGWSNKSQTITIAGLTPTTKGEIGLAMAATAEQVEAASKAKIRPTTIALNSVTLICDGEAPTIDLPITILKVGD